MKVGNSAVECWSILAVLQCTNGTHDRVLIDTLDRGSLYISTDTRSTSPSVLNALSTSQSVVSGESTNFCRCNIECRSTCIIESVDTWPTIDQLSIECWSRCWSRCQSRVDKGVSNDAQLRMPLVQDLICVHLRTKIGCKYLPHADGAVTTEVHVNCVNMQCTGVFDTVASNPQTKALCLISSNIYLHWIL